MIISADIRLDSTQQNVLTRINIWIARIDVNENVLCFDVVSFAMMMTVCCFLTLCDLVTPKVWIGSICNLVGRVLNLCFMRRASIEVNIQ